MVVDSYETKGEHVAEHATHFEELKIASETLQRTAVPAIRWRNITEEIARTVAFSGIAEGNVTIQVKHTTAALVFNEDERGLIEHDLPRLLERLAPPGDYRHDDAARILALPPGEPKNAPAHLRGVLGGQFSLTLIVHNGRLELGTWQSVLFFDFDPESHPGRAVVIQVSGAKR